MDFKINFIFIVCIIFALMFVLGIILAVKDSIKKIKQGYKAYVFLDFDDVNCNYILEIYDFRDDFFEVKEFETYSDFINYFHDELCPFLQLEEFDIFQVTSRSYQKKIDSIK